VKVEGIDVEEVDEENTSKMCRVCGETDENQRVERGLYVCDDCDVAFNADVNGAENIRLNINDDTEGNSESGDGLERLPGQINQVVVTTLKIGVPAGWHSPQSTCTTSPVDSNRNERWWTANRNIPTLRIPPHSRGGGCQAVPRSNTTPDRRRRVLGNSIEFDRR
jgi:hypothetical protein